MKLEPCSAFRMESACRHSMSVMSHPVQPAGSSSADIGNFVQSQRKIISNFRTQPWPMQVKIAAIKWVPQTHTTSLTQLTFCRSYRRNLSRYVPQLNKIDTFRDSSGQVYKCVYTHHSLYTATLALQMYRRMKRVALKLSNTFTIWGSIIKRIEGVILQFLT